jgi:hypothetical protein
MHSVHPDRVLTPRQVAEVLADDYSTKGDAIVFVMEQSGKAVTPVDMMLVPFIQAELSQDHSLGMVYGTGSGCALLRTDALQKVQAEHRSGRFPIRSCADLMEGLKRCGYRVQQDEKLSLDLLP